MQKQTYYFIFFMAAFGLFLMQNSCKKKTNPPHASLTIFPSAGATSTLFTLDASGSRDDEDDDSKLFIRMDWENDGTWDSDWTVEKSHTRQYDEEGRYTVRIEVRDSDGVITGATKTLKVTNSNHLTPTQSPFSYNVGINYETWTVGRNSRNIDKDLDTITNYFRLIKTYHCAAVGTSQVIIDPTMNTVIQYLLAHEDLNLELALGTNNNVLATGGWGKPWEPGLMTTKTYTDQWVQMLISAFGSTASVKKFVKVILLGNEVDDNGPLSSDTTPFKDYHSVWIPGAFDNLKQSLADKGLPDIPVSTIIANYPLGAPGSNIVASSSATYVKGHWSPHWNSASPFVLFNQYTQDSGKSVDFGPVILYFESVDSIVNGNPAVYVGETGYSAEYTEDNEAKVLKQIFSWLDKQYSGNNLTIPLFVFQGYDRPDKKVGQKKMGIFKEDAGNMPQGLKKGIQVPAWVKTKH